MSASLRGAAATGPNHSDAGGTPSYSQTSTFNTISVNLFISIEGFSEIKASQIMEFLISNLFILNKGADDAL